MEEQDRDNLSLGLCRWNVSARCYDWLEGCHHLHDWLAPSHHLPSPQSEVPP